MEELKSAMDAHMDQMADLVQKLSSELRSGLQPAYENFVGFFHAVDWTERWLMGMIGFHVLLLIVAVITRRKTNFQMGLFLLTSIDPHDTYSLPDLDVVRYCKPAVLGKIWLLQPIWVSKSIIVAMVRFAEILNGMLRSNWRSFATQNYFDPQGLFLSAVWSGPLLVIACLILINTLFNLCYLIVKWKRAELRHRARLDRDKQE
ncbi:Transmembrane protein 18 [Linum grandiflorum]